MINTQEKAVCSFTSGIAIKSCLRWLALTKLDARSQTQTTSCVSKYNDCPTTGNDP